MTIKEDPMLSKSMVSAKTLCKSTEPNDEVYWLQIGIMERNNG